MPNYRINQCPVLTGTRANVLDAMIASIESKQKFQPVITLNVSMFSMYEHHLELFKWLINHAVFTVDGISISLLILKQYGRWVNRYPGIDMVHDLLQQSSGYRVAMIGASSDHLNQACDYFQSHYVQHQLVFSMDGFSDFTDDHMATLRDAQADIILIAMGCPHQDEFLQRLANALPSGIGIGVGGVFDVWAGAVKRAPIVFRILGLEWLVRLIQQPKRVFRLVSSIQWLFR